MPLTTVYQKVRNSVVRVAAASGGQLVSYGTGTVFDTGKLVLTCAHCAPETTDVGILAPNNAALMQVGKVLCVDRSVDIAILEFDVAVGTPVTFASSSRCAVGNGAFVVGYPMGIADQTLLSAHIASLGANRIRIDSSINHGNSGGPLFNLAGEQIGIVNSKHGSLSKFLDQVKNAQSGASMVIGGIDPVEVTKELIAAMQLNLNLGIGYAIPTDVAKPLHASLTRCVP